MLFLRREHANGRDHQVNRAGLRTRPRAGPDSRPGRMRRSCSTDTWPGSFPAASPSMRSDYVRRAVPRWPGRAAGRARIASPISLLPPISSTLPGAAEALAAAPGADRRRRAGRVVSIGRPYVHGQTGTARAGHAAPWCRGCLPAGSVPPSQPRDEHRQPGQLAAHHHRIPGDQVLHRAALGHARSGGRTGSAPRERHGADDMPDPHPRIGLTQRPEHVRDQHEAG